MRENNLEGKKPGETEATLRPFRCHVKRQSASDLTASTHSQDTVSTRRNGTAEDEAQKCEAEPLENREIALRRRQRGSTIPRKSVRATLAVSTHASADWRVRKRTDFGTE